jgi:flavin-dependent dehydrogenase
MYILMLLCRLQYMMYDVIINGGASAGLAAAIILPDKE